LRRRSARGSSRREIIEAMAGHELGYKRSCGRIVSVPETEDEVDDDDFEKIKQE